MASFQTVTQATSKTTAVTLDAYQGRITTVALTDAADGSFNFTFNNKNLRRGAQIFLQAIYGGTTGNVAVNLVSISEGSCVIKVQNVGTAVLNAAMSIDFSVFQN